MRILFIAAALAFVGMSTSASAFTMTYNPDNKWTCSVKCNNGTSWPGSQTNPSPDPNDLTEMGCTNQAVNFCSGNGGIASTNYNPALSRSSLSHNSGINAAIAQRNILSPAVVASRQSLIHAYRQNSNRFAAGANFAAAGLTAGEAAALAQDVATVIEARRKFAASYFRRSGQREIISPRIDLKTLNALRFRSANDLAQSIVNGSISDRSGSLLYATRNELNAFFSGPGGGNRALTDTCIHYCSGGGGAHNAACGSTCNPDPCAAATK